MRIEPEVSGCSIVMVGHFNPAIFHPAWLEQHDVEPGARGTVGDEILVHRDISRFQIDTRSYHIDEDRFQITTTVAPWVSILDIVGLVFGQLLPHSPVRAFGVNRTVHFRVADAATRVKIGRELAPIGPWGDFGTDMEAEEFDQVGGLQSLTMRKQSRFDEYNLQVNAKVQPSVQIENNTGVYMEVNCHHNLQGLPDGHGANQAVEVLSARFEESIAESEAIIDQVMGLG